MNANLKDDRASTRIFFSTSSFWNGFIFSKIHSELNDVVGNIRLGWRIDPCCVREIISSPQSFLVWHHPTVIGVIKLNELLRTNTKSYAQNRVCFLHSTGVEGILCGLKITNEFSALYQTQVPSCHSGLHNYKTCNFYFTLHSKFWFVFLINYILTMLYIWTVTLYHGGFICSGQWLKFSIMISSRG